MILSNKMFKVPSLCIIGTIAITINSVITSNAGMGSNTTMKNSDAKAPKEIAQTTDTTAESGSMTFSTTIEDGKVVVTEDPVPTVEEPVETTEAIEEKEDEVLTGAVAGVNYNDYIDLNTYVAIGINKAGQYLNVRKGPGASNDVVGKMPPYAGATVLDKVTDAEGTVWSKIKSGDVVGYVMNAYLATDDEALGMVKSVGRLVIKVDCDLLNIRKAPSTNAELLFQISKGEELDIISIKDGWIEVGVDVGQETAWVSSDYVKISYELYKAIEIDELLYGYSSTRIAIVNKAKEYLGNRYVYGGTSLENGIDCSGFMMRIYEKFGYSITRTSRSQATQGKQISKDELKPGDLVFYGRGSSIQSIYHVAMYIGNGKIIHASNPRSGIKISNMNYTTPCRYVSILQD